MMKNTITIIAFLLALFSFASCHKDKEFGNEKPKISEVEVSPALNQADFTWKVEYLGKFQTGVEISDNEALNNSRTVEGSKAKDAETYKATVDRLEPSTTYYYRIVVWNKMSRREGEVKSFSTLTPDPDVYTITVSANPEEGGTVTGGGEYFADSTCTLKATANEGYTFVNWTENGSQVSAEAEYSFMVKRNKNLVANFTSQAYIIQVGIDPEEGGSVEGAGGYNLNDECALIATANEGYDFVNWTKEDGTEISTDATYRFTVTESTTYVAHFQKKSYAIEVSANPVEGGTVMGGGTFQHGDICEVKAVTNEGYNFVNWTENNGQVSGEAEYTFTVANNRHLVANFTSQAYLIQVQIDPEEGGVVEGAGGYDYGQECTLKATANEGYDFVNWTEEDGTEVSSNATYHFTVSESATYVAHFQIRSYTIFVLVNDEDAGRVSGGGTFNHGENCTLTATANTGYDFDHWTKDGTTISGDATINFTVAANATYIAYFTSQTYTITTQSNPSSGGTVSGGGSYTHGQPCTVTATANEGYQFVNWTENGEQVSSYSNYTFEVFGNRTLVANFSLQGPVGAIGGRFTINNNGDQVYFSQGNLQYQASTNTWRFAENQWDYVGQGEYGTVYENGVKCQNMLLSETYNGWIDLFGWGTSGYNHGAACYQPWSISDRYSFYYAYGNYMRHLYNETGQADWGFNAISNGGNQINQWRTLTIEEWQYVFDMRNPSSGIRFTKAQVNGVNGVILFPDDWNMSIFDINKPNEYNASYDNNVINSSEWIYSLQANGAVFFPASGMRYAGDGMDGLNTCGCYWSSKYYDNTKASDFEFYMPDLIFSNRLRYMGFSVRLVCPAE